jgi:hypothetical protein
LKTKMIVAYFKTKKIKFDRRVIGVRVDRGRLHSSR